MGHSEILLQSRPPDPRGRQSFLAPGQGLRAFLQALDRHLGLALVYPGIGQGELKRTEPVAQAFAGGLQSGLLLISAYNKSPDCFYGVGGEAIAAGSRALIPGYRAKSPVLNVRICAIPWTVIAATSRASWAFLPTTWWVVTSRSHSG